MSSAAARAEARKKAILSRGSDRLSKLTSSARGEDHPAYMNNEPPTRRATTTETFIGDETIMPTPPARSSPAPDPQPTNTAGPTAWTAEQQQEFMRALMNAPDIIGGPARSAPIAPGTAAEAAPDDPMAAVMSALTMLTGQALPGFDPGAGGTPAMSTSQAVEAPRPKTVFEKLLPLLHLVSTWVLLAFFALYKEPEEFEAKRHATSTNALQRWAELGWREAKGAFGVQPVSFFWAFVTLQLVLHSTQIFTRANPVQPPTLLALALPHLPPTIASIILTLLRYLRMGGMLLDDMAGLLMGVGVMVLVAGWTAGR